MNKIKVGAFGAFRGIVLMQSMLVMPEVELVAVLDKDINALNMAKKMAETVGIQPAYYTDFEEFFKHDMDAVILSNFATEHAPFAVRLMNSGRHVMSEVPACENVAQCVELIEAAEKNGVVYTMAENYCYMDDTFEMKRRYELGDIGEISYAEGAYIHDQSSQHPSKTKGDPDHWRNTIYSTFYCTHAVNPLFFISDTRPVQVTGLETPTMGLVPHDLGYKGGGAGILMVRLNNGGVVRGIVAGFKREPWADNINYTIYGTKGTMETHAIHDHNISVYIEREKFGHGTKEDYYPKRFIAADEAEQFLKEAYSHPDIFTKTTLSGQFHRCGDFYPGYFFIQKILGRPEGKYAVDVYRAVDASLCGIMAYRSILNGGSPVDIPDLRDKNVRDAYRGDIACTTKAVAGDQLIPSRPGGNYEVNPAVYEYVRKLAEQGVPAEHGYRKED